MDSEQQVTQQMSKTSPIVGMIFLFNLMVGTGALALPAAFAHSGWIVSTIAILFICSTSYVTNTFIIEAMAIASAVDKLKKIKSQADIEDEVDNNTPEPSINRSRVADERDSLLDVQNDNNSEVDLTITPISLSSLGVVNHQCNEQTFELTKVYECGTLAKMFFNKTGTTLFYLCLCLYLYGDLAIYSVGISKSITVLVCSRNSTEINSATPCVLGHKFTTLFVYNLSLLAIFVGCGSFAFFHVQKTKYLQIITSLYRWIAFTTMIVLASIALATGHAEGKSTHFNFSDIPNLFGVSIYAFMCHHSIPSIVTPIKDKSRIFRYIFAIYLLIFGFYTLLSVTGMLTFEKVQDVYTSNFMSSPIPQSFIVKLLPLFPVVVLSTNFPIVANTLSNNLRGLIAQNNNTEYTFWEKYAVPMVAIIPPVLFAFASTDLEGLMGLVGGYSGLFIQWLVPAFLVKCARSTLPVSAREHNKLASPFKSNLWVSMIMFWTIVCLICVTIKRFL